MVSLFQLLLKIESASKSELTGYTSTSRHVYCKVNRAVADGKCHVYSWAFQGSWWFRGGNVEGIRVTRVALHGGPSCRLWWEPVAVSLVHIITSGFLNCHIGLWFSEMMMGMFLSLLLLIGLYWSKNLKWGLFSVHWNEMYNWVRDVLNYIFRIKSVGWLNEYVFIKKNCIVLFSLLCSPKALIW